MGNLVRMIYQDETIAVDGPSSIHIYPDYKRDRIRVVIDAAPHVKIHHCDEINNNLFEDAAKTVLKRMQRG